MHLLLSVRILQLWPVRTHIVLLSSSVVQVGRVKIFIWKRFPARWSSIYLNNKQQSSHSTLFSLYVDHFSLPTTYGNFLHTWYSWISSLKLFHDDWCTGFPFMAMILNLCPDKHMWVLGCLFVVYSGQFLIVLCDDVKLNSDWLSTTFLENWQHYIEIE